MRLTSSSRILGVLSSTGAEGVPSTCDLDACHATPAEELMRGSLSMGRVTLILIVPSSNWAIVGIDEGALAKELCVKSRYSPAGIGPFPSQGVGAGVAGPLGLGGTGDGLCFCAMTYPLFNSGLLRKEWLC